MYKNRETYNIARFNNLVFLLFLIIYNDDNIYTAHYYVYEDLGQDGEG